MSNNDKRAKAETEVAEGCKGCGNAGLGHRCCWKLLNTTTTIGDAAKILKISHKQMEGKSLKLRVVLNTLGVCSSN